MCEHSVISRFERVHSIAEGVNKDFPMLVLSSTYRNAMREIESFIDSSNPSSIKFNCGTFVVNGCKIIPFGDYRKLAGYDRQCKLLEVY